MPLVAGIMSAVLNKTLQDNSDTEKTLTRNWPCINFQKEQFL